MAYHVDRPIDTTRRLLRSRSALLITIGRYEKDLKYVHWVFLTGLFVMLFGLFLVWLVVSDVTLLVMGSVRYVADPMSFGAFGALIIFLGCTCLFGSVYVKLLYPTRLDGLRKNLQELNNALKYQHVFPNELNQSFSKHYDVYYEDLVKRNEKIRSLQRQQNCIKAYGYALCFMSAGIVTMIQGALEGYPSEAFAVGMLFIRSIDDTLNIRDHRVTES